MATKGLTARVQFGNVAGMNAVSERLKTSRKEKGLTVSQAAALVPCSRSTWFRWETGIRAIGPDKVPRVAEILDVPGKELRPDLAKALSEDRQ